MSRRNGLGLDIVCEDCCLLGEDGSGSSLILVGVVPFAKWPLRVVTGIIVSLSESLWVDNKE